MSVAGKIAAEGKGGETVSRVELVERRRAGVAVQLLQEFECLLPPPVKFINLELALVLLAELFRVDDVDASIVTVSEAVHSA